ncbi:MAG: efflux RND transporter periplasmic adaptor subunit [Opitutaceae bacterium]|nr:efflux RND transporter periplasmic adaptor subunit [Opitutaceae bacterium]
MNPARFSIPFLALALFAGCADHGAPEPAANLPPVRVRATTMRIEEIPARIEVTGTVRPVRRAMIAAKVMGAIEDLPVALGQHVHAGDLLVKISAGEIFARVLQAQAQLNQARRDLDRERDLLTKSASTPDMVKGLEDRLAMTQAMVREAEVMLGYASVRAPFDGVVARKLAQAGDLAAPGQPLLEIEGTDNFQVEAGIPDSLVARLGAGTPLAVTVPAAGAAFTGALVELSSAADPLTRTVMVKISVPAGVPVGSGQYARVQVPGAPVRALLAPAAAVSTLGQLERVFVVNGSAGRPSAGLRLVKTGAARGSAGQQKVEILAGLAEGDRIVINPSAGLQEGQPLEVEP